MFLIYEGEEELDVKGYVDASFQTDQYDCHSQAGFVYVMNGGAVSWMSSKQDTVADSLIKAEYIAACEAAKEGVWIRKFLQDLGVFPGWLNHWTFIAVLLVPSHRPSVGNHCMENKKFLHTRNDLSMEMHNNEGESMSAYPRRP